MIKGVAGMCGLVVEDILQNVEDRPDTSTREVSRAANVLHSIVWLVLRDEGFQPLPYTESEASKQTKRRQALIPADYAPRVEFAR
ncbi:hypothetical protein CDAR_420021 [Caerostris darwini]|uniref:Uncharacterized protein n=1 Tax=Caerostris darwini TaxID=1538125 RepID=A0AAV4SR26_9ARAC|nr:hypothetical protein CDAR_420021 [Caerostris darwini]